MKEEGKKEGRREEKRGEGEEGTEVELGEEEDPLGRMNEYHEVSTPLLPFSFVLSSLLLIYSLVSFCRSDSSVRNIIHSHRDRRDK